MLLSLQSALLDLLRSALPDDFGGTSPDVSLAFTTSDWSLDPSSADATAGQAAQDDARDLLPFEPGDAEGPYTLTQSPYPGPRRVYVRASEGDRLALTPSEVSWDPLDDRVFTLHPRPTRMLTEFDQVEVRYGVTAVFTKLKSRHEVPIRISAPDDSRAERSAVLALAVLALHREELAREGGFSYSGGDYSAAGEIKTLLVQEGATPGPGVRTIVCAVELEVKVSRVLTEGEGAPIEHIVSPGITAGARPVDVRVDVES